ncbi:MAG: ATP-dependent DNA helicase [Patescibacteria group bacterium]
MKDQEFSKYYNKLNEKQLEAVNTLEGPVMVIAGPGTGKTQILAMRIANILRKTQASPSNILCLTFTNSGVQAMKQRLLEIIGVASYQIHIHTFHSFCNEVIGSYPERFLTAKKINQLTDLEQIFIIQKILKENDYKFLKPFKSPFHYQGSIRSAIGNLKQENMEPEKFKQLIAEELNTFSSIEDLYHEKGAHKGKIKAKYIKLENDLQKNKELADIYYKYQKILEEQGKYDYSDMILFVLNAFKSDPEILATYQERYQYILVDEYQDTNSSQNSIVQLLGSFYENPNIFVVGDDEQSVFRFQGASLENIIFFKELYPEAKMIVLENNYRSIQKILDVSRTLIQNNKNQIAGRLNIEKKLKSQLQNVTGDIELAEFSNGSVESYFVAKKIEELIKNKVSPNEIAILYKEHRDSEELIDFLSKLNIPYIIEVGGNILEDPEIDKIITYLKALNFGVKQVDNQLLMEVMHYSFFGISPLDIYKIVVETNKKRKNIFDIVSSPKILEELELDEPNAVKEFVNTFLECRHIANTAAFAHAFEHIINATGYLNYLLSLGESVHHLNRLQTLFDEIKTINTKNKNLKLNGFLEYIGLLQENNLSIKQKELSANYEGVHLMTAHKSKGLEFEYVFLIHCTDKHWGNKVKKELIKLPKSILKSTQDDDPSSETIAQDEEERRLFYVALTRAKKQIFLTHATAYGEADSISLTVPSKFITELSSDLISRISVIKYENEFDERLKLTFAKKKWEPSEALSHFLEQLIHDFKLSPTALNSYLECPQRFFYDNILRVPKTKDFTQSYGTAVHKALELLFKKYRRDFKLPSKEEFIGDFLGALEEEIFTVEERKRAIEFGQEILSKYYDFYDKDWQSRGIPLSCEYDFSKHDVHFKDIPVTGKIDRIDLADKLSNNVRIIDYKTSSPKSLNFILGNTKEKDTKLMYQAYFYKLLSEVDPIFQWQVGEIEFDFISPDKASSADKKFKRVSLPIDDKQYSEFKTTVEKVYDKIINLEFHLEEQACKKSSGVCAYYNICHNNQNE